MDSLQLILTKLNRPRIAAALVSRPHLLQQLTSYRAYPFILISAPPGYGKTTLVADWLANHAWPSAWLSLDENDNDLAVFLAYLTKAIRTVFPDSCSETAELLRSVTLPAESMVAATLINDLERIDQHFVVVLDDYHAIHNVAINELIKQLLHHPPTHLQLVIITRRDPLLPLSRYRARGRIAEIRAQQLRFMQPEVATLIEQMTDRAADASIVERLESQSEGWITGLRLALLASFHEDDPASTQPGEAAGGRYTVEYLMTEVFAQQPPAVQDFLLKMSILDRMSAPLCDAVVNKPNHTGSAQEMLRRAWDDNLFMVSLDARNEWFRYHHLLRHFLETQLRRQVSPDEIRALHARAASWLATEGYLEEAIRHFLHAEDETQAIQLVLEHRHDLMKRGYWTGLHRLLQILPRHTIESEPGLLLTEAWLLRIQWRSALLVSKLKALDALLKTQQPNTATQRSLAGEVDVLYATVSLQVGASGDASERLRRALDSIDKRHEYVRGYARMLLANVLQMHGDKDAAIDLLSDAMYASPDNTQIQIRACSALALIYYLELDLDGVWLAGTRYNEITRNRGEEDGMLWGQYRLGIVNYFRNELTAAEQCFVACSDRPRPVHTMTTTNTAIGLALTYQAQGRVDQAREIAERNVGVLVEMGNTSLLPLARAFEAELAARQGRLADAQRWVPHAGALSIEQEYIGLYAPQLALPKILLKENDQTARKHAAGYLVKMREALERRHNRRFLIEVLALQALLYEQEGDRACATAVLEEAVEMAMPGRVLRVFADIGAGLRPALVCLAEKTRYHDFLMEALALFDMLKTVDAPSVETNTATPALHTLTDSLTDSLTNREMDVLLLLAERMTNKEIAQQLGISTETVKQHASNLFQKLDVGNRRQAVARARMLGILHDSSRTASH